MKSLKNIFTSVIWHKIQIKFAGIELLITFVAHAGLAFSEEFLRWLKRLPTIVKTVYCDWK